MDFKEIKQFLKHSNTLLVLEDGQPSLIIMDYKMFQQMEGGAQLQAEPKYEEEQEVKINHNSKEEGGPVHVASRGLPVGTLPETELLEKLNKEILALKSQIEAEEKNIQQNALMFIEDDGVGEV